MVCRSRREIIPSCPLKDHAPWPWASRTVRKHISVAYTSQCGTCYHSLSRLVWHRMVLPVLPTKSQPLRQEAGAEPYLLWPMSVLCFSDYGPVPSNPRICSQETRSFTHGEPRGVAQFHHSLLHPPLPESAGAALTTQPWLPPLNQFVILSAQPPWGSLAWNFCLALALASLLVPVCRSLLLSCSADHGTGVRHTQNSNLNLRHCPPSELNAFVLFTAFQNHTMSWRKLFN